MAIRDKVRGKGTKPVVTFTTEQGDDGRLWSEDVLLFRLAATQNADGTFRPTNSKIRQPFLRTVSNQGCFAVSLRDQTGDEGMINDEWLVYGDRATLHRIYILEMAHVVAVEQLLNVRVPVLGSGAAPSGATQRQAYKDQVREMRTGREAKLLAKDNRFTDDEGEGAWARPDVAFVPTDNEQRPVTLANVANAEDVVLADKGAPLDPRRDSQQQRKNRARATRSASFGIDAAKDSKTILPTDGAGAGACNDGPLAPGCSRWQRCPTRYCRRCDQELIKHVGKECPSIKEEETET